MTNLPATSKQEPRWKAPLRELIAVRVNRGLNPAVLASGITKDPKKRKLWRNRIRQLVREDALTNKAVLEHAHVDAITGLGPATRSLVTRAVKTGRASETKLLWEATGFHNSHIRHEHGGEVTIKLDIPRPTRVLPEGEVLEGEATEV